MSHLWIIFLGLCERAAYVQEGNTSIFKWNILGLKHVLLSYIYPFNLCGVTLGIAFDQNTLQDGTVLRISDQEGKEVGTIKLEFRYVKPTIEEKAFKKSGPMIQVPDQGWLTAFLTISSRDIVINNPGVYFLSAVINDNSLIIGQFHLALIDPPPITQERIAAIKSDPNAAKAVIVKVGCKKCPDEYKIYAALEPNKKLEETGHNQFQSIPDDFICSYGTTKIDLRIIRRNLHGLLGQKNNDSHQAAFTPLYEASSLEDIRSNFLELLKANPKEELLQQFIQENPVLLHQFPAEEIFFKPPILTFFKADIGIVTHQKELILIELEKTSTKLIKRDGGLHSELNHAFDQVRDWLPIVDEHRLAVLDSLNIDRSMVSTIRGVVIAGRDIGYDAKHLRRHKGTDWGRITFLTYDDLLFSLDSLIRKIEAL